MDVNYHTQVQPNHGMTFGLGSDYADKSTNNATNMPDKVDKVNQGTFDRSMDKNASENTLDQQTMQQIMERLAPLIAQFIQEIMDGVQQDSQPSSESSGVGESQGAELTDQPMNAEQESMSTQEQSPQEQLIQQILDRLLPYIEQMLQEINGGNSQGEPSGNVNQTASVAENGIGSDASQPEDMQNSMNSGSETQSQQDQLMQQLMQILVPMIAQIIESVLGQGGQQAQGMSTAVQSNY